LFSPCKQQTPSEALFDSSKQWLELIKGRQALTIDLTHLIRIFLA